MRTAGTLLDRGIPDATSTSDLPIAVAAEVDYLAGRTAAWAEPRADVHPGLRARALVLAGDHDAARAALDQVDAAPPSTQGLAAAIWAASRVGRPAAIESLSSAAASLPPGFLLDDDLPLGPSRLFTGLLAAARGDLAGADGHLREAASEGDARAPIWGAIARLERARVLWCGATIGDDAGGLAVEAQRALAACQTFFTAGGYQHLAMRARSVPLPPDPADSAAPSLGHLVPGPTWTVGFGVQPPVEVRASKGLVALHHVVAHRGAPVPAVVLDLVMAGKPIEHLDGIDLDLVRGAGEEEARELTRELRDALADDRIRSRMTKLIRRTIDKLGSVHPLLARHLGASVQTGYACRYVADQRVVWRL